MIKIAAIFNEAQEITTFEEGSCLLVFIKEDINWQVKDEIHYRLDTSSSMAETRDNIRSIILQLMDCKILIGKSVTGLAYNILDRMGFIIYEAASVSDQLFDEILTESEEAAADSGATAGATPTSPVMTSEEGVYYLNLIELQEQHPEISSKKALKSFIETTPFYKLEVVCSHIPPWFDALLPQKRLIYSTQELQKNVLKVEIIKKVC